ncbi:hypothetical protein CEW46_32065 [Bacillus cereus]|nr:hypothetical protein CEW46_32065 [Bacillus cereus]
MNELGLELRKEYFEKVIPTLEKMGFTKTLDNVPMHKMYGTTNKDQWKLSTDSHDYLVGIFFQSSGLISASLVIDLDVSTSRLYSIEDFVDALLDIDDLVDRII